MAELHNIHLRTGCFCNPGACQRHLKLSDNDLKAHYKVIHLHFKKIVTHSIANVFRHRDTFTMSIFIYFI